MQVKKSSCKVRFQREKLCIYRCDSIEHQWGSGAKKFFLFGHFSLNLHRKPLRAHTLITHNSGRFATNPRQIIIKRQQLTGY